MTAKDFRTLALGLKGAAESEHMGHPDFRRGGKVFATLGYPEAGCAMVKLTPDQQGLLVREAPDILRPANGAWGKAGSTIVELKSSKKRLVKSALSAAFNNIAPKNTGSVGERVRSSRV